MSRPAALTASGIFTLLLLAIMGLIFLWTGSASVADSSVIGAAQDQQAEYEARVTQAQSAMADREAQYQARLAELERLAGERDAEYQARLNEVETQLTSYETRYDQILRATAGYQEQIPQLEKVLGERQSLFEARRQEFEAQRQQRLSELLNRLNQGQIRLQEANAQLGK